MSLPSLINTNRETLSTNWFSPVSVFQGTVLISLPFLQSFLSPSVAPRFSQPQLPSLNLTCSRKSFMQCDFPTVAGVNSLDVLHVILSFREALVDSSL